MGLQRVTRQTIERGVAERKEFTRGNVTGRALTTMSWECDRLPDEWRREYRDGVAAGVITFAVFSYRTPMAWYRADLDGWVMPDVKYSLSTTQHQGAIRFAIVTGAQYAHA